MVLEINLVKTQSQYSPVGGLLERARFSIDNDSDLVSSVLKFISDNEDVLSSMIPDKAFVTQLTLIKTLSIDQLHSLRYTLSNYGLNLWFWVVTEGEPNASDLQDGTTEYNVVDCNQAMTDSSRYCSKVIIQQAGFSYAELYKQIYDKFELFKNSNSKIYTGMQDPLLNSINMISQIEKPIGTVPNSVITNINHIFEFVGKKIYVII